MTPSAGSGSRVTTIVAPAGYGKTTLLRELVGPTSDVRDGLYLSLRDCEHHPALFLDLLVSAVQRHLPTADLRPLLMLKKSSPPVEYGERLPYVLARVFEPSSSGPVVLALDDIQEVSEGEPLTDLLCALLASEPGRLRFVLASRHELPFALDGYRDRDEVLELRAADLALTEEEVEAVLAMRLGHPPTPRQTQSIWEYTRGWPAVVSMLSLEPSVSASSESPVDTLTDFVVSQVLSTLSPPLRYVLKAVSVLDGIESEAARFLLSEPVNGRQLRRPMSRFISVPEGQVVLHLDALRASQLLVPSASAGGAATDSAEKGAGSHASDGDDAQEVNPAVRDVLRALFEREDPRAFRHAHHRAAEHYRVREPVVTAATIEHLVQAGDLEHVLALLEERAEHFFDGGATAELFRWLQRLEAHFATLPMWACYYLGRHYTAAGDWERARGYLDTCKAGLTERDAAGDSWRWQPRVCLGFATLYWRRGMSDEARTYCRRGLDLMRQLWRKGAIPEEHGDASRCVQLGLLNLLARLKLERGIYDKAADIASEALTLAEETERPGEASTALCQLGGVASHRGDFDEARRVLESAIERVEMSRYPRHHVVATFELGRLAYRMGDTVGGRSLIEDAVCRGTDTCHPSTMARLHGFLGEVRAAHGDTALAEASFATARALGEGLADAKIQAEVLDRQAIFLATLGRKEAAQSALRGASDLVAGQLKTQLHLNARHYEARAECAAMYGDYAKAGQHFRHAVERSQKIGARYHVARLSWRAARHCHEAFVAGAESTPEPVLDFMDIAAAATKAASGQLGNSASLEVLHIGAAFAREPARAICTEILHTRGVSGEACGVAGLDGDVLERYRDYRRRAELEDDFVLTERVGRRGANARDVESARGSVPRDAVVLLVEDQLLINAGVEVSLAEKRVILPLLLHFLHHPEEVFTMTHLSAQVWGAADARKTMQTKVKVAISRLRGLLGKDRPYILTSRVPAGDDGETVVAYGLAPEFPYLVVERVPEDLDA